MSGTPKRRMYRTVYKAAATMTAFVDDAAVTSAVIDDNHRLR